MNKTSSETLYFRPLPLLSHPLAQTIIGSFGCPLKGAPSEVWTTPVEEGNAVDSKHSVPEHWTPGDPIVVMTHGLSGSTESRYMVRMSRWLFREGKYVVRVNHRGISCDKIKSRILSHGGVTSDLLALIKEVHERFPDSPMTLIGFSVGANMVLKLLGELGHEAHQYLERAIAVSPPVSLYDSALRFNWPVHALIQRSFSKKLKELVRTIEQEYPSLEPVHLPKNMTILDFDEHYTAPMWGYRDAAEYYEKNSSGRYVSNIDLPCRILYSLDDPLVSGENIEALECPSVVEKYKTEHGGHLGFLGYTGRMFDFRWMDHILMQWINENW